MEIDKLFDELLTQPLFDKLTPPWRTDELSTDELSTDERSRIEKPTMSSLLEKLIAATTDEERNWIVIRSLLESLPTDLALALWTVATPEWFNAEILAALCPKLAGQADKLYLQLQKLPCVEVFPERGHNIHELTRREILNHPMWLNNLIRYRSEIIIRYRSEIRLRDRYGRITRECSHITITRDASILLDWHKPFFGRMTLEYDGVRTVVERINVFGKTVSLFTTYDPVSFRIED